MVPTGSLSGEISLNMNNPLLTHDDEQTIIRLAKTYQAKRVFLFGSMLYNPLQARDIDLGIEGVRGVLFFRMMSDLSTSLSKPVDVVDMDVKNPFTALVERDGKVVYEHS